MMDAHFQEYLAAVTGMQDVYGERSDDHPTEFHDDTVPAFAPAAEIEAQAGSHWDA
jgi:hypothetical protein